MNFGIPVKAHDAPPKPIRKPVMSIAEDAKICNARMRKAFGLDGHQAHGMKGNADRIEEANARDAAVAKITLAKLIIAGQMCRKQLIDATGLTDDPARRVVKYLISHGMIEKAAPGRYSPWRAVTLASGSPPIPVVVRGQHFPSMSACAKHFGISRRAVYDAIERGRTDFIGLGTNWQHKQ